MTKRRPSAIEVVSYETGSVVHTVDVRGRSEGHAERTERGVNINLDHERFYTRLRYDESEQRK